MAARAARSTRPAPPRRPRRSGARRRTARSTASRSPRRLGRRRRSRTRSASRSTPISSSAHRGGRGPLRLHALAVSRPPGTRSLRASTGSRTCVVATLSATPRHPDLEGAVGPIARPLPIRVLVPEGADLRRARSTSSAGSSPPSASQQDRLPRQASPAALGVHSCVPGSRRSRTAASGSRSTGLVDSGTVPSPLALACEESPDGGFRLALVFDRGARRAGRTPRCSRAVRPTPAGCARRSPARRIRDLELPRARTSAAPLLAGYNDTAVDASRPSASTSSSQRRADRDARKRSRSRTGTGALTYGELETRANQLAHRLRTAGIERRRRGRPLH